MTINYDKEKKIVNIKKAVSNYIQNGPNKTRMPLGRMFVLAIAAGAFIAFAGAASTVAASTISNASVAKTVTSLVFPAGLALVVAGGTELFTGNCLLTSSLAAKQITWKDVCRNWAVVYIGNFAGAILVSMLFSYGHVYDLFGGQAALSAVNTANAKCLLPFGTALLKGIGCNILVCVAVMNAGMGETVTQKIGALYLPIFMFVVLGLEHSIANMSYITTGLLLKNSVEGSFEALTVGNFLLKNLLPVTVGNMIGGCLTGIYYWFTTKD